MIDKASLPRLNLLGGEKRELMGIIDRIKSNHDLPERIVLLIQSTRNNIATFIDWDGDDNGKVPVLLSPLEQKIIDLYRATVEKLVTGTEPFDSFESIEINRLGVLNLSFVWGGLRGSESDQSMSPTSEETRRVIQEILRTRKENAEIRERIDKIDKETNTLIIEIVDDLVPDSPQKEVLKKILSPSQ